MATTSRNAVCRKRHVRCCGRTGVSHPLLPDLDTITLLGKHNAKNLGSGQSPVSRRLLYTPMPLRLRIDSVLSITIRYES